MQLCETLSWLWAKSQYYILHVFRSEVWSNIWILRQTENKLEQCFFYSWQVLHILWWRVVIYSQPRCSFICRLFLCYTALVAPTHHRCSHPQVVACNYNHVAHNPLCLIFGGFEKYSDLTRLPAKGQPLCSLSFLSSVFCSPLLANPAASADL